MEDSQPQKSSQNKHVSSHETINDSSEESGWTYYLEDFQSDTDNTREKELEHGSSSPSSSSSFDHNSCLVSDAASGTNNHVLASTSRGLSPKISKKVMSSMKMRRQEIFDDDSLEDTASSPIDSSREREETGHRKSQPESDEENELSHQ